MKPIPTTLRELNRQAWAVILLCATTAIALPAQTLKILLDFNGANGSQTYAAMVQATDGNLYAATSAGGASDYGAIVKMTPGGKLSTLYSFCTKGAPCVDGAFPYGTLVQAANGDLYGTTLDGGAQCYGCGSVFKITPSGALTTIYSFACPEVGRCPDGANPESGLVEDAHGNFYGTTLYGGANDHGTVFKLTSGGAFTLLHSFCVTVCTDGEAPYAGLILAGDGDFYGTTSGGGAFNNGSVFKITPSGTLTTVYSFCAQKNCADGFYPYAGVIQATDGKFYGTTSGGGAHDWGTVFKLTPGGKLTTLYNFCSQSGCTDGEQGYAALIQGSDGNLYGSTALGGLYSSSGGTIFQVTSGGAFTTLYSFCAQGAFPLCTDGEEPQAALVQDTNGNFYGTTTYGGKDEGVVFGLSMGLGPFVKTQPTSGAVGAVVNILGTNLTGATSVTFDGTPAAFEVVSSSLITATVPSGASSGTVQVATPGGTLSSNLAFQVLP